MLSLMINDTFDGIGNDGRPPDPIVGVGPESLIAAVNTQLALFDKDSNNLVETDLDAFFDDEADGFGSFDPWAVYDRYSDRFIVLAEEVEADGGEVGGPDADEANLLIGVSSSDAPADLSDTEWVKVSLPATHDFGDGLSWIDYPKLAADADSIYITGNYFLFAEEDDQEFQGSLITRLDKADLFDGIVNVTAEVESDRFTLQPAQSIGRLAGDPQLFAAKDNDEAGIDVFEFDDSHSLTLVGDDLFDPWTAFSGGAPQAGSDDTLDTLSDRLMNAVWANDSLWTTHTVDVDGLATVRWYEIATAADSAMEGQVGDIRPGDEVHTYMPAIGVDDFGNMGITYTQSSEDDAATMMVAGQLTGNPDGFTLPGQVVRVGAAGYDPTDADEERWGDYAGIGMDPIDRHTFWAFGEVAENTDDWETVFAQFTVGPLRQDKFDLAGRTNNSLATATVLGSLPKITLRDLNIDDADDVDYFQYTAQDTGKVIINTHFQDAIGNLDLRVFDESGDQVGESTSLSDDEQIVIPVVTQESYFIRVEGSDEDFNVYDLEIENFPAPVPNNVVLDRLDDTGMSNRDAITSEEEARVIVEADLHEFFLEGIDILSSEDVADDEDGAAVEVFVNGSSVGYADLIADTMHTLFEFNFAPGDLATTLFSVGGGGMLSFVTAAVRMFDGQTPQEDARTPLSESLQLVFDQSPPDPSIPDLLTSSDSGNRDDDNVTSIAAPAFSGTAEANTKVHVFANDQLVGQGVSGTNGDWEVTVEPLDDGAYEITTVIEDLAGNRSDPSAPLEVWVDTVAPNTPYLDLISDTGRHDADEVTNGNRPEVTVTANDTEDGNGNPFWHDIKYRIYDRPGDAGSDGEVLIVDSWAALGDFSDGGFFNHVLTQELNDPAGAPLNDGVHNLKLEVEDRAGNLSHDFLLVTVVDTEEPPVSLGQPGVADDGLRPESDTGVSPPNPDTIIDRVTGDTTPTFWGRAEANAIIRLYADGNGNGVLDIGTDVFLGQDTAIPTDGTNQEPEGYWEITSVVDLGDETFFSVADGSRTIFVTGEDLAGNVNAPDGAADDLDVFVDTSGPVVESVFISDAPGYDLFDPKPVTDGPTPAVESLTITFSDLPDRVTDFLFDALKQDVAEAPGNFRVVGDHSGVIFIEDVIVTNLTPTAGAPAEATVEVVFAEPLPDDRFTLTVFDSVTDPVGNPLDGDLRATEPGTAGDLFPSGDTVAGGDFAARFTVDSRPEVGTWGQGNVWVDINGNLLFDPEGQDNDATNRDFVFKFGRASDAIFAGNFSPAGAGPASGFDKLGAYGFAGGTYRFLIDTDDDGVVDTTSAMPAAHQVNGIPVAGDFAPGHAGDEIGLFDGEFWYLDTSGNNRIEVGERFATNLRGLPVVGDFNGDGFDDLATFNNDTGRFFFDTDRDGTLDDRLTFNFTGFGEIPVAGDLNLDGVDDIGTWTPGREGAVPSQSGEFHFLVSDSAAGPRPRDNFGPFSPAPLGNDLYAQFGDDFALPVFGNFDPPVAAQSSDGSTSDPDSSLDVNGDGSVTALDALQVINLLNRHDADGLITSATASTSGTLRGDTNADGRVSALDALNVINHLNRQDQLSERSETASPQATADAWASSVDAVLGTEDDDEDDDDEVDATLDLLLAEQLR